jgi:uncharacterized protein
MIDAVLRLVAMLRNEGFEVSTSEVVDGLRALEVITLAERSEVRDALRCCLVKRAERGQFDRCFAAAFGASTDSDVPAISSASAALSDTTSGALHTATGDIHAGVLDALIAADDEALRVLAAQAVAVFAGLDAADGTDRYFLHRVMRALDLSRMLSAAMRRLRADDDLTELELMLQRSEMIARLDGLRRQLAEEIARQRDRDMSPVVPAAVESPAGRRPEELDVLTLSVADAEAVRRVVQPMVRRLASRVGRRTRRRPTGRLDARRTVRNSLQSGGVPLEVATRTRRPHRAELVVLCDVSGSVAEFSQFSFTFVNALHEVVRSIRSFAFVDGVAEVTDLFATATYDIPVNRMLERRGVVGLDGHSDYGKVFEQMCTEPMVSAIGPRSTVIICGDARSNFRDGNITAFSTIARRARRLYWMNPEPTGQWARGDSLSELYRPWCTDMFEVRTLRQLAATIEHVF